MNKWYNDSEARQMPHHYFHHQQFHHDGNKHHSLNENQRDISGHRQGGGPSQISGHNRLPHFSQMMTADIANSANLSSLSECNVQGSSNAYPYTYPSSNNSCDWRSRYASSNEFYCQDGYRPTHHQSAYNEGSYEYRVSFT